VQQQHLLPALGEHAVATEAIGLAEVAAHAHRALAEAALAGVLRLAVGLRRGATLGLRSVTDRRTGDRETMSRCTYRQVPLPALQVARKPDDGGLGRASAGLEADVGGEQRHLQPSPRASDAAATVSSPALALADGAPGVLAQNSLNLPPDCQGADERGCSTRNTHPLLDVLGGDELLALGGCLGLDLRANDESESSAPCRPRVAHLAGLCAALGNDDGLGLELHLGRGENAREPHSQRADALVLRPLRQMDCACACPLRHIR
jgi:hypothetical protein